MPKKKRYKLYNEGKPVKTRKTLAERAKEEKKTPKKKVTLKQILPKFKKK